MNAESALSFVENEFVKRKSINDSYSLRAYARDLQISPAVLSQVISRKKDLTPKVLNMIAPNLNIDKPLLEKMLKTQEEVKKTKHVKHVNKDEIKNVDMESFSVISDWYHYAILELFQLDNNDVSNSSWIAKKIGITEEEANKAIERLEALKLVERLQDGQLSLTNNYTAIQEYAFTSVAMRERQKQILKLSAVKIDKCDLQFRDHSTITVSMDPALILEVKEKIKNFRRSLGNFIAKNSKDTTAVYEMQISFFPLTETSE